MPRVRFEACERTPPVQKAPPLGPDNVRGIRQNSILKHAVPPDLPGEGGAFCRGRCHDGATAICHVLAAEAGRNPSVTPIRLGAGFTVPMSPVDAFEFSEFQELAEGALT